MTTPCPPVLMLIFNRPDLTRAVFARIRDARPAQLFIAADGPRADRPGEAALCREARTIADAVDWPCQVHTLFREQNLGPKVAVSSAITWFFDHVEAGIILEDDCLPDATFFPFCAEMLERYRDDARIMTISGNNYQFGGSTPNLASYTFSRFPFIWGWATWRRAWQHYDLKMTHWPQSAARAQIRDFLHDPAIYRHYAGLFNQVFAGEIVTWDYQWTYSSWRHSGLTILPAVNLVTNIGFDERGTNTKDQDNPAAGLPTQPITFPLTHPPAVDRDEQGDKLMFTQHILGSNLVRPGKLRSFLRQRLHPLVYRRFSQTFITLRAWLRPRPRLQP